MKRKLLIALALSLFAVGAVITTHVSQDDIKLKDIKVMAMASLENPKLDTGVKCSWGYKRYNAWYSFSDGVDCACSDRAKVAGSCG